MRDAEEWVLCLNVMGAREHSIKVIRLIQADAIRWAANLSGDLSVVTALEKADELDPPPSK